MLVTISGLPGSGTSTVAARVAAQLSIERLDGGTVFRSLAAARGLDLAAFSRLAESDPSFDMELDAALAARARAGDVVLESRLAGWIATNEGLDAVRVWIECDPDVRAARVAERDGVDPVAARAANEVREASERQRYLEYYAIDIGDRSIYDVIVDSAERSPVEITETIVSAVVR